MLCFCCGFDVEEVYVWLSWCDCCLGIWMKWFGLIELFLGWGCLFDLVDVLVWVILF